MKLSDQKCAKPTFYYALDENHRVVPSSMLEAEALFRDITKRRVALTEIGNVRVSTVFLAIDHSFGTAIPPVLFETMVFDDGETSGDWERCCTWNEAVAQHERVVAMLAATRGD